MSKHVISNVEDMQSQLQQLMPDVDAPVLDYMAALLIENMSQFYSPQDVLQLLKEFILGYEAADDERKALALCSTIFKSLPQNERKAAAGASKESEVWVEATEESRAQLQPGARVQAQFVEDQQFYPAVIERVLAIKGTFLVLFTEYGNKEEVSLSQLKVRQASADGANNDKKLAAPVRIGDFFQEKKAVVRKVKDEDEDEDDEDLDESKGDGNEDSAARIKFAARKAAKEERKLAKEIEADRLREQKRKELAEARSKEALRLYLAAPKHRQLEIHIQNFSMSTPDNSHELLMDATLRLVPGRRYGLIGRNGVGKTTLMRHISYYELPNFPQHIRIMHVEQEVVGDERSVLHSVLMADVERATLIDKEAKATAEIAAIEAQMAALPAGTSAAALEERLTALSNDLQSVYNRMREIDADSAESRASSILQGLGFAQDRQLVPTSSLSGGWRMRVALAQALFVAPDLLLLDEPTNHLDFPAVLWLEEYLQSYDKTLLLVSHDRAFVNEVITDIIHFDKKELNYYRGNYDTFEKVREEKQKQQQSAFESQKLKRDHVQKFIDKFRYNAKRASLVQSRIKALDRMQLLEGVEDEATFRFEFPDPDRLETTVIAGTDIAFGYSKDHILLSGVDFRVDMDSRVGVLGANGVGKSTLLKLMLGELEPLTGTCKRNDAARVALFAQHHMDGLKLELSPLLMFLQLFPKTHPQIIRRHLGAFGITQDLASQRIGQLSGGQKSRVAFALVTWKKPHVIIMDEPTNHLDLETIDALIMAVNNFAGGLILVSHDQHFLASVCTEFWGVSRGQVKRFDNFEATKKFSYGHGQN